MHYISGVASIIAMLLGSITAPLAEDNPPPTPAGPEIAAGPATPITPEQDQNADPTSRDSKTYQFSGDRARWLVAYDSCLAKAMKFAVPTTFEEALTLAAIAASENENAWIGVTNVYAHPEDKTNDHGWRTIDGDKLGLRFTESETRSGPVPWRPKHPIDAAANFVVVSANDGLWDRAGAKARHAYICQAVADGEGS